MPLRLLSNKLAVMSVVMLLAGCQSVSTISSGGKQSVPAASTQLSTATPSRTGIDVPLAWGGELRCNLSVCRLISVEHETSNVVLYEVKGREAHLLDRQPVAYHPDSAIWLADDLVVVAVEFSFSLDVFRVVDGRLKLLTQIPIDISPRDVMLVHSADGRFRLLATPYSGKEVVWVDFSPEKIEETRKERAAWCEAPWHPVRVQRMPSAAGGGIVAACLDEKRVAFVANTSLLANAGNLLTVPGEARLVPRYTRPSPSGQWLYVAIETGGRNLRMNMDSGELQWIQAPQPVGSVSVLPLSDDLVVWGVDSRLYLQRLAADGTVLETRTIPTDGFSTGLQLIDADRDGVLDIVVHNSAVLPKKMGVEIIYGPLWERAQPHVNK